MAQPIRPQGQAGTDEDWLHAHLSDVREDFAHDFGMQRLQALGIERRIMEHGAARQVEQEQMGHHRQITRQIDRAMDRPLVKTCAGDADSRVRLANLFTPDPDRRATLLGGLLQDLTQQDRTPHRERHMLPTDRGQSGGEHQTEPIGDRQQGRAFAIPRGGVAGCGQSGGMPQGAGGDVQPIIRRARLPCTGRITQA